MAHAQARPTTASAPDRSEALAPLRQAGRPLDSGTRHTMEARFQHSFAQVRVHDDAMAHRSAEALGARAYAAGPHLVFGPGAGAPERAEGGWLLAHELAHVVQQSGTGRAAVTSLAAGLEREADGAADRAVRGEAAGVGPATAAPGIQRQPKGDGDGDGAAPLVESLAGGLTLDAFASDSAALTPAHMAAIATWKLWMAEQLTRYPNSFVTVVGHTDATDTEAHNETLGQQRADAVLRALTEGDGALPAASVHAYSLGERMLKLPTQGRSDGNRRVEVQVTLRGANVALPAPQPTPAWKPMPALSSPVKAPAPGLPPFDPFALPAPPPAPRMQGDWLRHALDRDPLIRSLPDFARDKVKDALKDADEKLADAAIGALPLDPTTKAAVKAVVDTLLKLAKGQRFQMPTAPTYQLPPSGLGPLPSAPGPSFTYRF